MALCTRMCLWSVVSLVAVAQVGCCCGPRRNQYLTQAQLRNQQLWAENRAPSMQRDGFGGNVGQLQQENAALKQNLDLANQRLNNLASSNNELEQRVQNMLVSANRGNNPLSDDMTRKLEELRQKYPEFEFDPRTGVSKFHTDLLFELGSDQVRPDAMRVLQEFSQIMNHADARHLNVLVVGHTDDKPISKSTTRARHPTNWHLSTDRADSVVLASRSPASTRSGWEPPATACSSRWRRTPTMPIARRTAAWRSSSSLRTPSWRAGIPRRIRRDRDRFLIRSQMRKPAGSRL